MKKLRHTEHKQLSSSYMGRKQQSQDSNLLDSRAFTCTSAAEQRRLDNVAAHTPAHRLNLQGETHGDSSSNKSMVLSLLIATEPCDPARPELGPF